MKLDENEVYSILNQLRTEDVNLRVFGAVEHEYLLLPPLPETQIAALESRHNILLPEDYRHYLTTISSGGAGPFYGLETLETAVTDSDLSRPFPLQEAVTSEKPMPDDFDKEFEADTPGALRLCHEGCARFLYLVVHGPAYGQMWYIRDEYLPIDLTFGEWYAEWLNRLRNYALPTLANERKIVQVQEGDPLEKVEAILQSNPKWMPHSFYPGLNLVLFENLATSFNVDQNRNIVYITNHYI